MPRDTVNWDPSKMMCKRDWTVWLRPTPQKPPRPGKGTCGQTSGLHHPAERRKQKKNRKRIGVLESFLSSFFLVFFSP